jgi:hypothetical protein
MADITDFQNRFVGQAESITSPNPRLASPIEEDDLVITLTAPLFNEDGVVPNVDGSIVIRNITTGYPEGINVKSGNISSDGQTITLDALTQRGQPIAGENGVDYDGGVEDNRSSHPQNSEVRWQISPLDMQMVFDAVDGVIGSGQKLNARPTFTGEGQPALRTFADSTARDAALTSPAAGDKCFLTDGTGEQHYDGVGWVTLGTATPITASTGLTKVGQDIQVDLASTNDLLKITSDELDTNLTASKTEIDQLTGTTNIAEADTFFGATDITGAEAETLTDGSNADSLHIHTLNKKLHIDTTETTDGTTTWDDVYSYTLPANTLETGKCLNIKLKIDNTARGASGGSPGEASSEFRITFGGTTISSYYHDTTSSSPQLHTSFANLILHCTGSSSQKISGIISTTVYNDGDYTSSIVTQTDTTSAKDITASQDIKVQVQNTTISGVGSANSKSKMLYVEVIN